MIPQNNPLANYLSQKAAIDEAIARVLAGGRYLLSHETSAFEEEFSSYVGTRYAVGVGSGTDALFLALKACGVGPSDEVITVSHTAIATVAAIDMTGAVPVLVDIEPDSYTISPEEVERALSAKTKAIIAVHLYGHPASMEKLIDLAKQKDVYVIEDCAQSHGARYQGVRVGSLGDAAAFSFYPTKNLGCLGDGGAITTNDEKIYRNLLALRQYGWDQNRVSHMPGINSRIDELQAAVLRVKLKVLDEKNQRRIDIARAYDRLKDIPGLKIPSTTYGTTHVYHQYVIQCETRAVRDGLKEFLLRHEIQSAIHYPLPVHLQPAYISIIRTTHSLSRTLRVSETILSLPIFPELSDEDVERVIRVVQNYFSQQE